MKTNLTLDSTALQQLLDKNEMILQKVLDYKNNKLIVPSVVDQSFMYESEPTTQENYNKLKRELFVKVFHPTKETEAITQELKSWCSSHDIALLTISDIEVAAICIQNGGRLLTSNTRFRDLPYIKFA
jgi:predicted nucleic acid-binding protein